MHPEIFLDLQLFMNLVNFVQRSICAEFTLTYLSLLSVACCGRKSQIAFQI